jgi:hypothetical protein
MSNNSIVLVAENMLMIILTNLVVQLTSVHNIFAINQL